MSEEKNIISAAKVWRQERPEKKGPKTQGVARLVCGKSALLVVAPTMKAAIETANKCARVLKWKQEIPWEKLP